MHVADALVALPHLGDPRFAADLGSGAGLPGLVLAAALPGCTWTLVESVGRKAAWIAETAERMGLENVRVAPVRAEAWAEGLARCDLVTARALAALPVLCEYAAPLLRVSGVLVCWKGAVGEPEAADGRAAAALLGLGEPEVIAVQPFPQARNHTLWRFVKEAETPPGYPRRPGMAAKRPLAVRDRIRRTPR